MSDSEVRHVYAVGHTAPLSDDDKQFTDFLDELNKETERGVALTAAAFVDELLKRILEAFLIPNKSTPVFLEVVPVV